MLKLKLTYSDGVVMYRTFASKKEADWFIHNEGDHLVRVDYE